MRTMEVFGMGDWFATEPWGGGLIRRWTLNADGTPVEMFLRNTNEEGTEET